MIPSEYNESKESVVALSVQRCGKRVDEAALGAALKARLLLNHCSFFRRAWPSAMYITAVHRTAALFLCCRAMPRLRWSLQTALAPFFRKS